MTGAATRPVTTPLPRPGLKPQRGFLWKRRFYLLLVVLPTLLAGLYFYGFATGQFASQAQFVVRGRSGSGGGGGAGGGALASMMGAAGFAATSQDALAVKEFLGSHDALIALQERVGLNELYRRPEADLLARLWTEKPPAELLQIYHNHMNTITIDSTSGIITLQARAFRPDDAQRIVEEQLRMSEEFVNRLSARAREASLALAREEIARAEKRVLDSQAAVTAWRQQERSVDPQRSAQMGLDGLGALEGLLTGARAELQEKSAYMRPDNPVISGLRNRIASLQQQINEHRQRMIRGGENLPAQLAAYERLALEREFADKQLASATESLESARVDAQRQQLFVTRIVQPTMAELAMYPRAGIILLSMFIVLSVFYGIGWMMVTGVREHAF
ncbi:capsule biosynthesis protein [Roseomonas sp. USHLN139]|uniref:capsule biosynthesis protein n=1 Tax=Roseomonas sp. USHLN139 TaxID=3081298 RepID=UPI003B0270DA